MRRPWAKMRVNSAFARTRADAEKPALAARVGVACGVPCKPGLTKRRPDAGRRAASPSGGEALAALGTATRKDLAPVGGLHAGAEAVVALALEVARLIGALGGHGGDSLGNADVENQKV